MITELFSLGGLIVLSTLLYLQHREYSKRINELTNALIARSAQELADLKHIDRIKPEVVRDNLPTEMQLSDLSDEAWMKVNNVQPTE